MNSKHWAILATLLYCVLLVVVMYFGAVEYNTEQPKVSEIIVEFTEPEPIVEEQPAVAESKPTPEPVVAPHHEKVAEVDRSEQTPGKAPQTQTVNQRALFKQNTGQTPIQEENSNPQAEKADKDQTHGVSRGLNPVGTDALDEGLKGRGLAGELPQPYYPAGNKGGKVIIRVAVDKDGKVTSATYEPKGSTTSDSALVEAAIAAAKRARFTESAAFVQGGTITYIFKLRADK